MFKPGSLPVSTVRVLTGDGALQSAIMIKSDDGHFVRRPALIFPILLATQAAAEAHRSQAAQEEQGADDHQQPARGPPAPRALGSASFPNLGLISLPCLHLDSGVNLV